MAFNFVLPTNVVRDNKDTRDPLGKLIGRTIFLEEGIYKDSSVFYKMSTDTTKSPLYMNNIPTYGSLMSRCILYYTLLATSYDIKWSLYNVGGYPAVIGTKRNVNKKWLVYDDSYKNNLNFETALSKGNMKLICKAEECIALETEEMRKYVPNNILPSARKSRALRYIEDIDMSYVPIVDQIFDRGTDMLALARKIPLDDTDRKIIVSDALSMKLLSIYDRVLLKYPQEGCTNSGLVPIRGVTSPYDINFTFSE